MCLNRYLFLIALGASILACVASGPAHADEVSGTVTAAASDQLGLGAYKYTVNISWSTSRGLSHFDLLLRVLDCDAICDGTAPIGFSSPAGTTMDGSCVVNYDGFVECVGDPSTQEAGPLLKFEIQADQECQPGNTGSGTFYFYTDLVPGVSQTFDGVVLIKNGRFLDYGDLTGTLPICQIQNAAEARSWGRVKTIFR